MHKNISRFVALVQIASLWAVPAAVRRTPLQLARPSVFAAQALQQRLLFDNKLKGADRDRYPLLRQLGVARLGAPYSEVEMAANRRNPKRLDGTVVGDAHVRVFRDIQDYFEAFPEHIADILKLWDRHYAVIEIKNAVLDYTSYIGFHRLIQIKSHLPIFDGEWHATGGTKMLHYAQGPIRAFLDALRLSALMSGKAGWTRLAIGGSKSPAHLPFDPSKDKLAKRIVLADIMKTTHALGLQLDGGVFTGRDINIDADDPDWMVLHAPRSVAPNVAPGSIDPIEPTAAGVVAAMRAATHYGPLPLFGLRGRVVALQGLGGVGSSVLRRLLAEGVIVIASELDAEKIRLVLNDKEFAATIAAHQLFILPPEEADAIYNPLAAHPELKTEMQIGHVDIFSPCATGGVINRRTIHLLDEAGAWGIIGSANDVLEDRVGHSQLLCDFGKLYVPDVVASPGGLLGVMKGVLKELNPWMTIDEIGDYIENLTHHLFRASILENRTTQEIADRESRAFYEAQPQAPLPSGALTLDGPSMAKKIDWLKKLADLQVEVYLQFKGQVEPQNLPVRLVQVLEVKDAGPGLGFASLSDAGRMNLYYPLKDLAAIHIIPAADASAALPRIPPPSLAEQMSAVRAYYGEDGEPFHGGPALLGIAPRERKGYHRLSYGNGFELPAGAGQSNGAGKEIPIGSIRKWDSAIHEGRVVILLRKEAVYNIPNKSHRIYYQYPNESTERFATVNGYHTGFFALAKTARIPKQNTFKPIVHVWVPSLAGGVSAARRYFNVYASTYREALDKLLLQKPEWRAVIYDGTTGRLTPQATISTMPESTLRNFARREKRTRIKDLDAAIGQETYLCLALPIELPAATPTPGRRLRKAA